MKITVLIAFVAFISLHVHATEPSKKHEKCGMSQHNDFLRSQNPDFDRQMSIDENQIQQYINGMNTAKFANVIYTIPVVVHVVYRLSGENITNAQIQSQIDVLNEDFGRKNADTSNTPGAFKSVASGTNFQFCLAKQDPNGTVTNGIERRQTTKTSFDLNDDVKHFSTGGLDAWDVGRYLNIWVCNLGNGILGYGEMPTNIHSDTYGVVVNFDAFGRGGSAIAPYHKGRTCTHEISHCFRLVHIWGDDNNSCTGTDYVLDTPNQGDATFGCPGFPQTDNCSQTSPGYMFMNYMDYTDDICMNMFTVNQASRMFAAINSYYSSLLSSTGCASIADGIEDASVYEVSIYPNPSSGLLTIDLFSTVNLLKNIHVKATNMVGEIVFESVIENRGPYLYQVDLSKYPSGIYFLTLYNDSFKKTERIALTR